MASIEAIVSGACVAAVAAGWIVFKSGLSAKLADLVVADSSGPVDRGWPSFIKTNLLQPRSKFTAYLNIAYIGAGLCVFTTNWAPVLTPAANFLGNRAAVCWAGWKFCNCLYMALANLGVRLDHASAITMVPYVIFDIVAALDTADFTWLCWSFAPTDALIGVAALLGNLKIGGVINALYVLAGSALFATNDSPVIVAGTWADNTFARTWAGWKLSGCAYYAMINLDVHAGLATAIAMVPYVIFDVYAVLDPARWVRQPHPSVPRPLVG
jgi:hypothetical protein